MGSDGSADKAVRGGPAPKGLINVQVEDICSLTGTIRYDYKLKVIKPRCIDDVLIHARIYSKGDTPMIFCFTPTGTSARLQLHMLFNGTE